MNVRGPTGPQEPPPVWSVGGFSMPLEDVTDTALY